jgi:hypothetical protein
MEGLKKLVKELGRAPTQKECNKCTYTKTAYMYKQLYGSWAKALNQAGIKGIKDKKNWTDEELRDSWDRLEKELGRRPTAKECDACEYTASYKLYSTRLNKNLKLDKEKMLENLKKLANELGRIPTQEDNNKCSYTNATSSYNKHFGSWNNALKLLGFAAHEKQRLTKEELLDILAKKCKELGRAPLIAEIPHRTSYKRKFGSLDNAFDLIGVKRVKSCTDEELIETIQKFYKENGRAPTVYECRDCEYLFAPTTYSNRFGTFLKAIEIAEVPLNEKNRSVAEKDLFNYISSIYKGKIESSNRSVLGGKEIDILIPDKRLAIEYNGLFWHNEDRIGKYYHLDKSALAFRKGYHLVHVFENEWLYKQDIVKSRLSSLLGVNSTIYARKCKIVEITSAEAKDFLEKNHIQGNAYGSVRYGLIYENSLVSLMTFSKPRFNKKYDYELLRFCNKLNTNVIGGASKLFKYFLKNIECESIISYSDARWNTGDLYIQLGFEFLHRSEPNYWYFDMKNQLYSRVKFQKHKLENILEKFDPDLTEVENMKKNGYNRIFDCGNDVFEYKG